MLYVFLFALVYAAIVGLMAALGSGTFGDCCGSLLFAAFVVCVVLVVFES